MTFDDFWLWLTGRTWKKKEITSSGPLFQDGIMSSCVSKSTYWLEFGNPNWEMVIAPPHGLGVRMESAPCFFHRWMQRLVLGIRYKRI